MNIIQSVYIVKVTIKCIFLNMINKNVLIYAIDLCIGAVISQFTTNTQRIVRLCIR